MDPDVVLLDPGRVRCRAGSRPRMAGPRQGHSSPRREIAPCPTGRSGTTCALCRGQSGLRGRGRRSEWSGRAAEPARGGRIRREGAARCGFLLPMWPPTTTLNPGTERLPIRPMAGVRPMSLLRACVQSSRQPFIEMLNLRGMFSNAGPRSESAVAVVNCSVASSSWRVRPVSGQPVTLRKLSIPVCSAPSPTDCSVSIILGIDSTVIQRSCIFWRVVKSPSPRPKSRERAAIARSWVELMIPFEMRMRSIK